MAYSPYFRALYIYCSHSKPDHYVNIQRLWYANDCSLSQMQAFRIFTSVFRESVVGLIFLYSFEYMERLFHAFDMNTTLICLQRKRKII